MAIDRGWRRWFALAGLALLLIGLWQVPWLGGAVYPFRVFGTFVHELSHGLAAIATGGDFVRNAKRLADILSQIAQIGSYLPESGDELAYTAVIASDLVNRGIVAYSGVD